MLPPQAPPAATSQANQATLDTLQRLADTQAWLSAQQDVLLAQPLATTDEPSSLLDAFWDAAVEHAPGMTSISRREAFAIRLSDAAKDIASLRAHDGTLSSDAVDLIRAVADHPPGPLPDHLHAFELITGGAAYAGALVLADDRQPDLLMLFTTQTGWETFASLDDLQRDVEGRLRRRLASDGELPGVATSDIRDALDGTLVGHRVIAGDAFRVVASRLMTRVGETVRDALATASEDTADTLGASTDLRDAIDIHAMVAHRDALLATALRVERLAMQPPQVRSDWQAAFDAYGATYAKAIREQDDENPQALGFADFTRQALVDGLLARGLDIDPDHIRIRVSDVPVSPTETLSSIVNGPSRETMSLSRFALRNIGAASTESIVLTYPDGSTRTDISAADIRQLVRELDLPNRYARHLDDTLARTGDGQRRRTIATDLLRARMRLEAMNARLGYVDEGRPRSFVPDQYEQGFRWVRATLDRGKAAAPLRVDGHELAVRQLTYRGAPLAGVLLMGPRSATAISRVVLYTPDAPDGLVFREFDNRARLERDFLRDPAFETYLVERLPAEFSTVDTNGIRRFAVSWSSRTLQWVFGNGDCAFCTKLEENFVEAEVKGSALDALYDSTIDLAKRNAHDMARSTAQADRESVARAIELFTSPATAAPTLAGEAAWNVIQSIPRTARAAWRFYDNVKAGDSTQAFLDFVDGYTAALDVVSLHALPRAVSGSVVRAAAGSTRVMRSGKALAAPGIAFEKRFVAHGVVPPRASLANEGVFVVDGAHYVQQGGKSYKVAFDPSIDGWRLTRPGALDATFSGPAVERLSNGQWHHRNVGLLGGGPRLPKSHGRLFHFRHISRWERSRHRFTPELDAMGAQELVDFQVDVYTRLGQRDGNRAFAALGLRRTAGVPGPTIGAFEQGQWDHALLQSRARRPRPVAASEPRPGPSAPTAGSSGAAGASASHPAPLQNPPLLEGFERIPPAELPEEVFYYGTPRELAQDARTTFVTLVEQRLTQGVQGVPLLTLPPSTPVTHLDDLSTRFVPRVASEPGSSLGSSSGAWVRLRLREAYLADTGPGMAASFEAYRSTTPGSPALVLRRPGTFANAVSPDAAVGFFDHYSIHFAPPH